MDNYLKADRQLSKVNKKKYRRCPFMQPYRRRVHGLDRRGWIYFISEGYS